LAGLLGDDAIKYLYQIAVVPVFQDFAVALPVGIGIVVD
jgi:hypothetical protein